MKSPTRREIATQAGSSPGFAYRYFAGKEKLGRYLQTDPLRCEVGLRMLLDRLSRR